MALLHEGILAKLDFIFKEPVFQGLFRSNVSHVKELAILGIAVHDGLYLVQIISPRKLQGTTGVQMTKVGEKPGSVILAKIRSKGIDGNINDPSIGFKHQNLSHYFSRLTPNGLCTIPVKVFQVSLVEGISNNLNI